MYIVLNVLTGMFADSAVRIADEDYCTSSVDTITNSAKEIRAFKEYIAMQTHAGAGDVVTIGWAVLEAHESAEPVVTFFKAVQINFADAQRIFLMRGSSKMRLDEFIESCLKVKSDIKGLDMVAARHGTERIAKQIGALSRHIDE